MLASARPCLMRTKPADSPLVSIVTPAYNQASYLAETIDSVLAQDYPNLQYLVLDDGSTDATRDVLQKYDGRVKWESHQNMGQARTLNKGWSSCDGEILAYISSDDLLAPNAVSEAVQCLIENPAAVVTYSDYFLIDGRGNIFREVRTEEFSLKRLRHDLICQPGPGAFFRRSVFGRCKGWRADLEQTPDFDFWLRASSLGHFKRIPKRLAYCRVHAESASYRPISEKRATEVIEVVESFWKQEGKTCPPAPRARAQLVAGKLHLQSKRYRAAARCVASAARLAPGTALSMTSLRIVLSGLARNLVHKVRGLNQ